MMLGWESCEVGCGEDLSLRGVVLTWGFDEREKPRDAQRLKWSLGQKEPIVGDCGNMTAQRLSIYSVVITAHVCLSYHRKGFLFFLSLPPPPATCPDLLFSFSGKWLTLSSFV